MIPIAFVEIQNVFVKNVFINLAKIKIAVTKTKHILSFEIFPQQYEGSFNMSRDFTRDFYSVH